MNLHYSWLSKINVHSSWIVKNELQASMDSQIVDNMCKRIIIHG